MQKGESQAKEAELSQQIGLLQIELEWLEIGISRSDTRERHKLIDDVQHEICRRRQCEQLGMPRSTGYNLVECV
jgi:hypothetical protein